MACWRRANTMPRRAITKDPVHLVLAMEHGYPQRFAAGSLPWRYLTAPGAPWSGTCTALTGRRARSSPCFGTEEIVMPLRESRATYGERRRSPTSRCIVRS